MNKLYCLLVFLSLTLASCSSDDDANANAAVDISGSWDLTAMQIQNAQTTTVFEGQTVVVNITGFGKDFNTVVVFSENPNYVSSTGTYTVQVTASVSGIPLYTEDIPVTSDGTIDGSWSLQGNNLVVTSQGTPQTVQIISLTQTEMVLEIDLAQQDLGQENNVTGTARMTLTR